LDFWIIACIGIEYKKFPIHLPNQSRWAWLELMEAMILSEAVTVVAMPMAVPKFYLRGCDIFENEGINSPDSASLSCKSMFMVELMSVSMV
jgi:hypothetical protein